MVLAKMLNILLMAAEFFEANLKDFLVHSILCVLAKTLAPSSDFRISRIGKDVPAGYYLIIKK